jgi:AraC-like DNA-binding protein
MNFYNAFRKETGLTPKQYADELEAVHTQELTSLDESEPISISEIQNPSGD